MDSGEGGGGDGGGGEERDADLSPQALSLPLLTLVVSPEQGSSSHTSAMAPAKEPLTLPQKEEGGAEGSQAREETQGGERKVGGRNSQENGVCQKQGMKEDFGKGYLSGQRKEEGEAHAGAGEASVTGGLPAALSSRGGEEEKEVEEAISNQSQTKSKCSLLPQQSQHSSSSSTAKASGTHDSKIAASPKPSPTPSTSPKPSPFLSTSPKHFTSPSSSSALLSETEVKDIKGDQGWISGFPQSFKSQQSTLAFSLAGMEPARTPAEDDGPAGVSHSSTPNGDGAKAPEPNDSQLDTEVDDERDKEGEQKEAVLKNLNQDLSPNSLTSHMTIMHSRNSCKTLKCPKCNWHYKSQHTLQVHMKEKHPETGGVCAYCSSGKPHPRLARGETYACGYKPYRCEVCDYATSSKGNLSIHMQSDKHLNNVQTGGHSNGHVHSSHISNNSSSSNGPTVDEPLTPPLHTHSHGKRWRCDVCDYETSIARNLRIHTTSEKHTHNMLRLQRGYYLSHCRSLAPQFKHLQNTACLFVLGAELTLNMRLTSQQVAEQPVTLGSTLTPSPSPSPSPPPAPSLSPTGPLSQGVFQCLVCSCFTSDSLESVEQHLNAPRSLPQSEWCSLVAGGCHCRLCGYTTPLRANFSLHCQTDRHRTRYQLTAHLQEGGDRGQEGAALIAKGNPVQLRCNLCDYVTSSLEKLQGHSLNSHHKAGVRVYRFLQQYDGEVDGGSWLFHCLLCNHSSSSKLQVLKHSQTPTHQQREELLQLQPMGGEELAAIFTIRKSPDDVTEELSEDMETSVETTTGPLETTKDTCNLGAKKVSEETGNSVANTEGDVAAPKDVTALLTPPLEDNTTHPSNGRLAPQSPTQIPPSSPPTSPPSDTPSLSDRHGYRFRCSRCSLAFPTQEKLQLHWQYHAMRAATECPLCSRQCRSQEALQRHMQNTHSQLDNTQGQNTLLQSHTAQYMEPNKSAIQQEFSFSPQVGQEAGEGEDEELEEEALNLEGKERQKEDVKMKEKDVVEVDGGEVDLTDQEKGPHEEIMSDPSSSSLVKKSTNPTMDRYLDPSRPYKCTICSESFTQKTILLVHFNSVSHLHRARRALQDSGAGIAPPEVPRVPDPRPYRCRLCGVGYSQSSTLDIHLRSVLHQTRARAAQNPASQTSASSLAVPVSVSTSATQPATTREEGSKNSPFTKRPDVVSSLSSTLIGPGLINETPPTISNQTDSQQAKKRVAELLASRNQLMLIQQQQLAQAQAQVQAQLQQHTALLHSQVMQHLPLGPESLLKQHFPLAPDNLLSLQQQLLLPFYLSGDMKLDMSSEHGHTTLLGQPSPAGPIQTGQQSQVSPTILEHQQGKRTRTRISEEQLAVLRRHFDINSLPSDEEINKMSAQSGLPHKVIKHWFRNTLFKERQRDKDSPYNFNNPPSTALEDSNISPQPQTVELQKGEPHRGRRSSRTRFTEQQLETLQGVFEATPYPREEEYDRLSALLSLPNRVIVVWFQNARQRARKNQDRGTEDGTEGKNQLDSINRQRNGFCRNDDSEDNSCGDEGQADSQNENSMDLTYEYYNQPDSPVDSSIQSTENEHPTSKGEPTHVTMKQGEKMLSPQGDKNPTLAQKREGISDVDIQQKEILPAMKTGSSSQPDPKLQPERTPDRSQTSQKTVPSVPSTIHSTQGHSPSPAFDQAPEKPAEVLPSLPSAPETETRHTQSDAPSGLSTETQPQNQLQLQTQAQFQCSLCPVSLSSFQLWQEHQTRHLLAAQSQVQLLHSGFTDRAMPYMMLPPNHTLMASQMLTGAIMQIKNTLSDHPSNTLTSLPQSSLTPLKQSAKLIPETSFEGQRGAREIEEEHRRDKRQRTTITPEQLEVLYQRYSLDSNPTRGVLESIARDVGLTRRVVQVWFQNTRARERKGQFRSTGPGSSFSLGLNHLRCPFCRALFKVKSALDAHIKSRHWAEAERAGYNLSQNNGSSGQIGLPMPTVMDRPGPSISSNLISNHGYVNNKELTVKAPVTSLSTSTDLNNPEEEDDYEEDDDDEFPCEEGSNMADHSSPSPEGSGGPSSDWGEMQILQQHHHHQQQRQRTQMSHFQVLQLRDFYSNHRTPNRQECETLGQELGLPHRVVQVWFQNARAKEKRARSLSSDSAEQEQAELSAGAGERDRA
ncbi:zinc finger homeobox protein 3-like [Echeneis naucrates]|uniref:zinc finger homeobox protein 3-like n=1 Tax=Echeneis naucrates TaxID=173247 RepID=UPI001113C51C|nr:zinc finger homeobox protein 3-like [Echeneis naucrates]